MRFIEASLITVGDERIYLIAQFEDLMPFVRVVHGCSGLVTITRITKLEIDNPSVERLSPKFSMYPMVKC